MNRLLKRVLLVIVLLLVCVSIYYKFLTHSYTRLFYDKIKIDNTFTKSVSNLYLPDSKNGMEFTYMFWINVPNIPENSNVLNTSYEYDKFILSRYNSPGFFYNIKKNKLNINLQYKINEVLKKFILTIDGNKLKQQRWTHIVLVLNNRDVSIYLNGTLHKSSLIPSVPFLFKKNIIIGQKNNNFNGTLFDGRYYNKALSEEKINSIYEQGGV